MTYTDEMLNELKSHSELNYTNAKAYADKHELSLQSVIGKARALEVTYVPKGKASAVVERKADVARQVQEMTEVEFKGLENMLLDDLVALRDYLK